MCGIAGILDFRGNPVRDSELAAMIAPLGHRGPDANGIVSRERVGLAHARLSIIDLEGGQQPMSIADGSLSITFNGEIFNFIELRAQLVNKGHKFSTRS